MHGLSPTNLFCLCDLWNLWRVGGQAQGVLKGSSVICGILGQLWRPPKFWFDILAQEFARTLQFMHHELRSQKPRTNARHVEILWFVLELWKPRKHSFVYYFLHSWWKYANAFSRYLQINDTQSGFFLPWFMLVLYSLSVSASIISLRAPQIRQNSRCFANLSIESWYHRHVRPAQGGAWCNFQMWTNWDKTWLPHAASVELAEKMAGAQGVDRFGRISNSNPVTTCGNHQEVHRTQGPPMSVPSLHLCIRYDDDTQRIKTGISAWAVM